MTLDPSKQFKAQLSSCEMRYTILQNELKDNVSEYDSLQKKKQKIQFGKSNSMIILV